METDVRARALIMFLESISAQAQNGLAFSANPFDRSHYRHIMASLAQISRLLSQDGSLDSVITSRIVAETEGPSHEYITPKVAVSVCTFNSPGEVLLVKRAEELWTLPGGYADIGLDPLANAEKEVKEETGMDVRVVSLVGVYDSNVTHFPVLGSQVYTLAFYAELLGGQLTADPAETQGAGFFPLASLPTVAPGTYSQAQRAFRVSKGEWLPVHLDRGL